MHYKRIIAIAICFLLSLAGFSQTARINIWTNAIGNNLWGTAGNWSQLQVPLVTDSVIFTGTYNFPCTINVNAYAFWIKSVSGYNKTITQQGTNILTVNQSGVAKGGIDLISTCQFLGGNGDIYIYGLLKVQNGSMFTNTTKTLYVRDNFDFSSTGTPGTFFHNTGKVVFTGKKDIYGSSVFKVLEINSQWGGGIYNFPLNDTLTVNDSLIITGSQEVSLDKGGIFAKADIFVSNTSLNNKGGGYIVVNGPSGTNQTLWGDQTNTLNDRGSLNSIMIRKSPADKFTVKGLVYISTSNRWAHLSGILIDTLSTVAFLGDNWIYADNVSLNTHLYNAIFKPLHGGSDFKLFNNQWLTIKNNLTLELGTVEMRITNATASIHALKDVIVNNTFVSSAGGGDATIIFNGTGDQHFIGNNGPPHGPVCNVEIAKTNGTLYLSNNITTWGDWRYTSGTLDAGTSTVIFRGNDRIYGNHSLYNVTFNSAVGSDFYIYPTISVYGTLTFTSNKVSNYYTPTGVLRAKGDIIQSNTNSSGIGGTATIIIDGTGNQNFNGNAGPGQGKLPNIIIDKSSGILRMLGTLSIAGNWTYVNDSVNADNSHVVFYNDSTLDGQGPTQTMLFDTIGLGDTRTRTLLGNVRAKDLVKLDAGKMKLNHNTLFIENSSPSALTRTTGAIISEDTVMVPLGLSYVQWYIQNSGAGNNYLVPFRSLYGTYVPFNFNVQAAGAQSGTGYFKVATYETDYTRLVNNRPLPPGVAHTQDGFGLDNNCRLVDRWWILEAGNYTTNPKAQLVFSYADAELGGTNCLDENVLETERWNTSANVWDLTGGTRNTAANTVTLNSVDTFGVFGVVDPNPPKLTVTASDTLLCSGDTIDFCVTLNAPANTYTWTFQGATVPAGAANDSCPANIVYSTPGSFDVILRAEFANVTITSTYPDYIQVNTGFTATANPTNITCNGAADGMVCASVNPSGTYHYDWSPVPQTTSCINLLGPGGYAVTVSDTSGACSATATTTVTEPSPVVIALDSTRNVTCNGLSNGCAWVHATGGTGVITYLWSPGGMTTASVCSLSPGTSYTVIAKDQNNCADTLTGITVTQPLPLTLTTNQVDVSCGGANDGQAVAIPAGGTLTYSYNWDGGTAVPGRPDSVSQLSATTYNVTVTDAKGCTATASVTISEVPPMVLDLNITDVSCNGGNDGAAGVDVLSGGTSPFDHHWSGGTQLPPIPPGDSVIGLTIGPIRDTVIDKNGCIMIATGTINEPAVLVAIADKEDISCNGLTNGKAWVMSIAGGSGVYNTPVWSNGMTADTIYNLSAGTYCVTITDSKGCTDTACVTIAEPAAMVLTMAQRPTNCNGGSDGCAWVNVSGGVSNYIYDWNPPGANNDTICSLSAGMVSVTVTDGSGCTATSSITVTEPTALSLTMGSVNVSCGGANDGQASVIAIGGTPYTAGNAYHYDWKDGGGNPVGGDTSVINGLSPDTYTVIVSDTFTCSAVDTVTITEIPSMVLQLNIADVACNGDSTGAAGVHVLSGGTNPYGPYSWSRGDSVLPDSVNHLPAGSISVTVSDMNGCTVTASGMVNEPTPLALTIDHEDISCNGSSDGKAWVEVSGANGGYQYSWDVGPQPAPGDTAYNLGPGVVRVTVSDSLGCSDTISATIIEPSMITIIRDKVDVSCSGGNDGRAYVTISGGTPTTIGAAGYTYSWSDGDPILPVGDTVENLSAGFVSVIVTDGNGCTETDGIAIFDPAPITLVMDSVNVSCGGSNDGQASVVASGGTSPYSYDWGAGRTDDAITGLSPGVYIVTVTDTNSCTASDSVTITEIPPITPTATVTHVGCNGGNNGAIDIEITGGTAPYAYYWSNDSTTQDISGLTAGIYTVAITDSNNCSANSAYTVLVSGSINLSANTVHPTCGNTDGAIDLVVTGGTGSYGYGWSNLKSSQDIDSLSPGTYTVTVTDNGSGCVETLAVILTDVGGPTVTGLVTNATNCAANDGAVDVTVPGPNTYTYAWSTIGSTTQDVSGLSVGAYTVTVIDDTTGCTTIKDFIVGANNGLTFSAIKTNATCGALDGAIDLSVVSGGGGYVYSWSNGANTQDISGLGMGVYVVTVTDANGCTGDTLFIINESGSPAILGTITDVSCFAGSDGAISMVVSPAGAYHFAWSNGANTKDISGLQAGTYIITVTDSSSNCAIGSAYHVTEPAALTLSANRTNVSCGGLSNGAIDLTISGGTSNYSPVWSNSQNTEDILNLTAGNYCVTVTDAHGCTDTLCIDVNEPAVLTATAFIDSADCNGASDGFAWVVANGGSPDYHYSWDAQPGVDNDTITGLAAGPVNVTVTDAGGCTATASVNVVEPSAISLNVTKEDISCFGLTDGKAFVTASGGTPGYVYDWMQGGSSVSSVDSATGLSAGMVIITVMDAHNCVAIDTIIIVEPMAISLVIDSSNISCNNGSGGMAWVAASGGTPGYTYSWDKGDPTSPIADTTKNLNAGVVTVVVADTNGCTDTASVNIQDPPAITTVMDAVNNNCFGDSLGKAWVVASGGTPDGSQSTGYYYSWTNNSSLTDTAYNLPAGNAMVTVSDSNGCMVSDTIAITQPPQITLMMDSLNIACNGETNGKASVTATGGTPYTVNAPYTYMWPGVSAPNDRDSIINVGAGLYTVNVTDSLGCTVSGSVNIVEPPVITLTMDSQNISCFGLTDGKARVLASGGTPIVGGPPFYTYQWSDGIAPLDRDSVNGLQAGMVTVVVTDSRNCMDTASVNIVEPDSINLTITKTDVGCKGDSTGTAMVTATGGTPYATGNPYTYQWSDGSPLTGSPTVTTLPAGSVTVTVTDSRGCFKSVDTLITEPATALSIILNEQDVSCFGGNDGKAWVTATGGTPDGSVPTGYQYSWSPNTSTTDTLYNLLAGVAIVTVSDSNGCVVTDSIEIREPEELLLTIQVDSNANCNGGTNGGLTVRLTGGTAPYDYVWSIPASTLGSSSTSNSVNGLGVGAYTVTVTDTNGCSTQISEDIGERPGPQVTAVDIIPSTCDKYNGSIILTVTSSDMPLTYDWSHDVLDTLVTSSTATNLFRGNYTVVITDASTCDTTITATVTEIPGPTAGLSTVKDAYCDNNDGLAIVIATGGVPPYTYDWSHDASLVDSIATNLTPQPTGYYAVTVSDANQCDTTLFFDISNIAAPVLNIDPSSPQTIFEGQVLPIDVTEVRGFNVTYQWSPSAGLDCDSCEDVIAAPAETVTYLVVVTDTSTLCTDSLYMTVIVKDEKNIFVPNVITPNGDGFNDFWNIADLQETFLDNELVVVNRWGDEVYRAKPYKNNWAGTYNGKPLPDGTYYYIIKLNNIDKVISGTITIVN